MYNVASSDTEESDVEYKLLCSADCIISAIRTRTLGSYIKKNLPISVCNLNFGSIFCILLIPL